MLRLMEKNIDPARKNPLFHPASYSLHARYRGHRYLPKNGEYFPTLGESWPGRALTSNPKWSIP